MFVHCSVHIVLIRRVCPPTTFICHCRWRRRSQQCRTPLGQCVSCVMSFVHGLCCLLAHSSFLACFHPTAVLQDQLPIPPELELTRGFVKECVCHIYLRIASNIVIFTFSVFSSTNPHMFAQAAHPRAVDGADEHARRGHAHRRRARSQQSQRRGELCGATARGGSGRSRAAECESRDFGAGSWFVSL